MRELKPLSRDAVDAALSKAERYRLLNEPHEAESICLDVLEVDPDNQPAHITLLLSLTDQFGEVSAAHQHAREALAGLRSEYDRAYYAEAMRHYERAEALRPAHNDDALLRWNACVRFLSRHPHLRPSTEDRPELEMLE